MAITQLPPEALHRTIDPKWLKFKSTDELTPLDSIIGQNRALEALELGLEIDADGYNIFVTGHPGTGRTTILKKLLCDLAAKCGVPDDWCYVYNFIDPDQPQAINLPAGEGFHFRQRMQQMVETMQLELRRAFASKDYQKQREALTQEFKNKKNALMEAMNQQAQKLGLFVQQSPMGFQTLVIRDGKPIDPETYNALPAAEKRKITRAIQKMEGAINNTLQQLAGLDMEAQKKLNQFSQDTADFIVKKYVNEVKRHYKKYDLVLNYLDAAGKDIALNIVLFLDGEGPEESEGETPEDSVADRDHTFYKYQVNVVVDNSRLEGAPVIHETNPTFINLLGRIEKRPVSGGYVTDFTMIKAGSLMKANGGFLMMEADEVLRNPYVYEALKRSLRNREARIEEISELSGMMSIVSLKPAAVPLKVKLVLIGWNHIYHELAHYDDDFTKVFKIRADFDYETESTPETLHQYAQFFKKVIDEEGLPSFDREAVTELLRYAHRIAGDQQRLSLEFGQLVRMIEQGAFWARKGGGKKVGGEHVRKAISAYERRHSLYNDKMKDHIKDNIVNINVSGQRIGEINALSVMGVGDFSFGSPNRITAKTFIGNEDLVNIERKAGLTGPIHDKGSYILEGFFYSVFGEHEPVSFSASLAFEQNYGHIDGDSASSTELYALLSSLARVPIKQGIAVTGSVNQNGEVQAIGGVNEKIEGFFEVCRLKGLTGEQGVMIPKSNAGDLLLKDEVREAVRAGQFHIWTVESIADGVELLMGVPAGERDEKGFFPPDTIYGKVIDHMDEFILRQKAYNHRLDLMHKKRTGGTKSKPKDKEKSPKKKDKTGKKG